MTAKSATFNPPVPPPAIIVPPRAEKRKLPDYSTQVKAIGKNVDGLELTRDQASFFLAYLFETKGKDAALSMTDAELRDEVTRQARDPRTWKPMRQRNHVQIAHMLYMAARLTEKPMSEDDADRMSRRLKSSSDEIVEGLPLTVAAA